MTTSITTREPLHLTAENVESVFTRCLTSDPESDIVNGVRSMYFVRVLETVGNGEVIEGECQFEEYEGALSHGIDVAIKRMNR